MALWPPVSGLFFNIEGSSLTGDPRDVLPVAPVTTENSSSSYSGAVTGRLQDKHLVDARPSHSSGSASSSSFSLRRMSSSWSRPAFVSRSLLRTSISDDSINRDWACRNSARPSRRSSTDDCWAFVGTSISNFSNASMISGSGCRSTMTSGVGGLSSLVMVICGASLPETSANVWARAFWASASASYFFLSSLALSYWRLAKSASNTSAKCPWTCLTSVSSIDESVSARLHKLSMGSPCARAADAFVHARPASSNASPGRWCRLPKASRASCSANEASEPLSSCSVSRPAAWRLHAMPASRAFRASSETPPVATGTGAGVRGRSPSIDASKRFKRAATVFS
mmetsp:Transcript_3161/g.7685  ORF Transcript_3161/g.7685 Transcript_3161/m.7685 type:complete len:341 (+) Transcript_3161:456-1478(+)